MELPKKNPGKELSASLKIEDKQLKGAKEIDKVKRVLTPVSEIISGNGIKGILPNTAVALSEEERGEMVRQKERKYRITCILKKVATILIVVTVFLFFWAKVNISENNDFLSKFGISKNTGKVALELENQNMQLEMENFSLENKIRELENKIKNKYYTLFSEDIKKIREGQITWFDSVNKNGELSMGVIDGIRRVADYFSDNEYHDPNNIITGRHEKIELKNITANRKAISFSATTTQILGRVIFMDIEFIDILNSMPIYKNGQHLNSFFREKNEDGDYYTEFSVKLDVQIINEDDPADSRFDEYLDWLKQVSPEVKVINYKNTN